MKRSLIILTAFALFFYLWYNSILVKHIDGFIHLSMTAHYAANYLLSGIVLLGALLLLHTRHDILPSMGLSEGFLRAGLFGILCTLPMLIGYAVVGKYTHASVDHLICRIVVASLFEELVFRGFAFGQMFRYAGWGFLPAALLSGVVFGLLHLYQGHDAASAFMALVVTALGSFFFSWLYVEWNYNLWIPIWLHTLMNAPWILFSVSDCGAVGGLTANILRGCTVLLAVGLTIYHKQRNALPYLITMRNLFINNDIK